MFALRRLNGPVASSTVAGTVALLAIIVMPPRALAQEHQAPTQNAMAGARVYGEKGCNRCHAINGMGGTEAPDLAEQPNTRSFYDLAATMWNHLPGMVARMVELGVARPYLSPSEAGDLIAFLYTLDYFENGGDDEAGRALFEQKRCISCHQVRGMGGVVGPNLDAPERLTSPIEVATALWNHGPQMVARMEAMGIQRPVFTASELQNLIAYLRGAPQATGYDLYVIPGSPQIGEAVFSEKGCIQCHAVAGSGGTAAPDLARRGAHESLIGFAAAMWNKAPAMTAAMQRRDIFVPQLTTAEMAGLVGYLYSLDYFRETGQGWRGRRLLDAKGCLECHTTDPMSTDGRLYLAARPELRSAAAVIAALWNHVTLGLDASSYETWAAIGADEMADIAAFLRGPTP